MDLAAVFELFPADTGRAYILVLTVSSDHTEGMMGFRRAILATVLALTGPLWIAAPVHGQEDEERDIRPFVQKILEEEPPKKPVPLLRGHDKQLRFQVSVALLRQSARVRDAVLTLATLDRRMSSETESVFRAMGQPTREKIAPTLLMWMKAENAWSWQAARVFDNMDTVPVSLVPALRKVLTDRRDPRAADVCGLLRRIGQPASVALPELRACLSAPREELRLEAARAIAVIDPSDTECVRVLGELAESGVDMSVEALFSLDETGARALAVRDVLKRCLVAPSGRVNGAAAHALAQAGPGAGPVLVAWLDDPGSTARLRLEVLSVLTRSAAWDPDVVRPAVVQALDDEDPGVRTQAIQALHQIGGFDAAALERFVTEDDAEARERVARALSECSERSVTRAKAALMRLLDDQHKPIRLSAALSLFQLGANEDRVLDTVLEVLRSGNANEKLRALQIIEVAGPAAERAIPNTIQAFQLEDFVSAGFGGFPIRYRAVDSLVGIGKPAVPALIAALDHEEVEVRALAARTLGRIGDPRALMPLAEMLDDRDRREVVMGDMGWNQDVRTDAIRAIAKLGDHAEPLIPQLMKLTGESWSRAAAARALANIGPPARQVIPGLLKQQAEYADHEGFEIARAIALIHPDGSIGLLGIRRVLAAVSGEHSWSDFDGFGLPDTVDLIVQLDDRARLLIPDLTRMVEEHPLLHRDHRVEAAYALARIDAANPKWRKYLERWVADEPEAIFNPAVERLEQLDASEK